MEKTEKAGESSRISRGPGLRLILVGYVVVPLTVAMAVAGYFALRTWENQVEKRMQSDLEMVARAVRLPLSYAMERRREGGIEQALESALSTDSVYSAYAFDLEGKEIGSAGKQNKEPEREKLSELASERKRTGEFGEIGERRVYSYFLPLNDSRNRASGVLQLTRREKDFRNYKTKVRRIALGGLAIAVLVMAGLVLVGQYGALERHFRRLIEGMRRVASGESGHRLVPSGPREVATISASFNEMLDSIQSAEAEIRRNRQDQLAMEQRLRTQEKLAAVGQLAAGVAHELGTPLGTVSGTAQRALRRDSGDPALPEALKKIRHEVSRMEVIIRQLLDFSHHRRLQIRLLPPARIAASAIAAVSDEAARHGASLKTDGESDLPPFPADPIALEQVLVNLLRNAIQAAPNVQVRLSWKRCENEMVFAVDDDGPGIPEDIQPRLFEPFFTTKGVGSGTGLGLAVVHGIVNEHRGRVRIFRSEFGGARVEIRLPFEPANDPEHS
jgi:signal transduction histidine kinase